MRLISWNVNGIRAVYKKGFENFFKQIDADIFCVQETKMQEGQFVINFDDYYLYMNSAEKKGYSGTAIFTKHKPLQVTYGIDKQEFNHEGRVITLEYEKFFLVNVYTPNSQRDLARLKYRIDWEKEFRKHLIKLDKEKPVIMCGDLNVAHNEIDLKNPKTNINNAGFTKEERHEMDILLQNDFIDTFRYKYPNKIKYTWWSYMANARERDIGWRIDYFIVSDRIKEKIIDAKIYNEIMGSDHCPIELEIGG